MRDFLDQATHVNPAAVIPLATLFCLFRQQLPEGERPEWFRLRFIVECVKAGFDIAVDSSRQVVVVGRALKRKKQLVVRGGRVLKTTENLLHSPCAGGV
jgi:hypothetical protein